MAASISLRDELYNQVVERARVANTTPEQWLDQIVSERVEQEELAEKTRVFTEEMERKMAARGVKRSDVEREIADYRRGR